MNSSYASRNLSGSSWRHFWSPACSLRSAATRLRGDRAAGLSGGRPAAPRSWFRSPFPRGRRWM